MLPVLFWTFFALAGAWIAWNFLQMFYEILRDAFADRKKSSAPAGGATGGTSSDSIDASSGFVAESSGADFADSTASESSSSEGSGGFESGGGESGGGGASGGW